MLREAWRAARAGERRLMLVAGEPGIGKTRLTRQFAVEAHEQGTVLRAGCEEEALLPYQPWVEALVAAEALGRLADEAGLSLIELAIAFVVNHPAVTSAIIGPRTMEQLDGQLPAAEVTLDAALLDRIDEIVRPGVNLNLADTSYGGQVLKPPLRRR